MTDSKAEKTAAPEVPLDREADQVLGFIVDEWRRATDENQLRLGISWADIQRWRDVGTSSEPRRRIYACLLFLVREGYLTEGRPTGVPVIPGLSSDFFWPAERAFERVDWDRKPWWNKAAIDAWQRQAVVAAVVSVVVSAIAFVLLKLLS